MSAHQPARDDVADLFNGLLTEQRENLQHFGTMLRRYRQELGCAYEPLRSLYDMTQAGLMFTECSHCRNLGIIPLDSGRYCAQCATDLCRSQAPDNSDAAYDASVGR